MLSALLAGLGEAVILGVEMQLLGTYTHRNPQLIWMAAVSNLVLFALPALVLWLVLRRQRPEVQIRIAVMVFMVLVLMAFLRFLPRVHLLARVLLSLGVAFQAGRLAAGSDRFHRMVRVTLWPAVALVAALAVGLNGYRALRERRMVAALPNAVEGAPNLLLIILDTVGGSHVSLNGYSRPTTPRLARFAQRGVQFRRASSPASWTLPSHASMFTGRWPREIAVNFLTPLGSDQPTLAEVLGSRGYLTGGFVGNYIYASRESGLDRGFSLYKDYAADLGGLLTSSAWGAGLLNSTTVRLRTGHLKWFGGREADQLNQDFLSWLSKKERRPFFAFVNYFDAHGEYDPPAPFDTVFRSTNRPRDNHFLKNGKPISREEAQPELDAYDGAIAHLDGQVGSLLDSLDARGELRNTIVIITSDHGEEFGEHQLLGHAISLYHEALHVPLVVVFPAKVPAGMTVESPVSTRDIAATILSLIGGDRTDELPGHALNRHWTVSDGAPADTILSELQYNKSQPDWFPNSKGDMSSLITARHHFILNGDGRIELYDLLYDSLEQRDLARRDASRDDVDRFRKYLESTNRLVPRQLHAGNGR